MNNSNPAEEDPPSPAEQTSQGSEAAQLVRALLERHGIPRHRHASFVGEFFGLSRAASHQRVNKSSAWTLDDFQALANRFGEPLAQVLGAMGSPGAGTKAVLRVGPWQAECRIWLAEDGATQDASVATPGAQGLVAMESGGIHMVVPATATADPSARPVARLEISQGATMTARVAVLDDERDVANATCAALKAHGVEAVAYYAAEDLLRDIPRELYDGYVIDWLLPDNQTAVPLLAAVRAQTRRSALVILTGKTRSGAADPVEVSAAVRTFRAQLSEKPVQPQLLISTLENDGLAPTSRAAPLPA
jgi:hypothetical protein